MQINDSTAECKELKLPVLNPKCNVKNAGAGYTVEGVAMFAGPIMTGRVTFVSRQLHHVHKSLSLAIVFPALSCCMQIVLVEIALSLQLVLVVFISCHQLVKVPQLHQQQLIHTGCFILHKCYCTYIIYNYMNNLQSLCWAYTHVCCANASIAIVVVNRFV